MKAVLSGLLCLLLSASVRAAPLRSGAFLSYVTGGEESAFTDGRNMESLSVFAYVFREDGTLVSPDPWVDRTLASYMANPGGRIIYLTVSNVLETIQGDRSDLHAGELVAEVLEDPRRRALLVRQMAALSDRAHGIEVNFERVPARTRPFYTEFVRELRAALPPGKLLSLVLQAKTTNDPGSRGRSVDWRAVEPYADEMKVMAYYYHHAGSAPGPNVPMSDLIALADYALRDPLQSIPRQKLRLVLSLYGWDWPLGRVGGGRLREFHQAEGLARSLGLAPQRVPGEGVLRYRYPGEGGPHEVWYEDEESLRAKVEALERRGVPRVDFWTLGTGAPRFWEYVVGRTARTSGDGVPEVRVFPNPWRTDQHAGLPVTFDLLPAASVVKIFTMSAKFVRSLTELGGQATWDLRDGDGGRAASGYYFFVVDPPSGEQARGVLSLIR